VKDPLVHFIHFGRIYDRPKCMRSSVRAMDHTRQLWRRTDEPLTCLDCVTYVLCSQPGLKWQYSHNGRAR